MGLLFGVKETEGLRRGFPSVFLGLGAFGLVLDVVSFFTSSESVLLNEVDVFEQRKYLEQPPGNSP